MVLRNGPLEEMIPRHHQHSDSLRNIDNRRKSFIQLHPRWFDDDEFQTPRPFAFFYPLLMGSIILAFVLILHFTPLFWEVLGAK